MFDFGLTSAGKAPILHFMSTASAKFQQAKARDHSVVEALLGRCRSATAFDRRGRSFVAKRLDWSFLFFFPFGPCVCPRLRTPAYRRMESDHGGTTKERGRGLLNFQDVPSVAGLTTIRANAGFVKDELTSGRKPMNEQYQLTDADRVKGRAQKAAARGLSPSELISKANLDVGPTQEAMIRDRLLEMPVTCRGTYLRAMKGKSMQAAIKAHCLECVGWIRAEVEKCTAMGCALYPYKPFQDKQA